MTIQTTNKKELAQAAISILIWKRHLWIQGKEKTRSKIRTIWMWICISWHASLIIIKMKRTDLRFQGEELSSKDLNMDGQSLKLNLKLVLKKITWMNRKMSSFSKCKLLNAKIWERSLVLVENKNNLTVIHFMTKKDAMGYSYQVVDYGLMGSARSITKRIK